MMKWRKFEAGEMRRARGYALETQCRTGEQEERHRHQLRMHRFAGTLMRKAFSEKSKSQIDPPHSSRCA